jgi:hypothetical protein
MANRKNGAHRFFPLQVFAGFVMIGAFAICVVYLKVSAQSVGREIKAMEAQRMVLRERQRKEDTEWALIRSPASVENALRQHGLVMTWPRSDQVLRLALPSYPAHYREGEPLEVVSRMPANKVVMNE